MSSGSHSLPLAPATLDYECCTAAELCKFSEERTGTRISIKQSDNVDSLINQLRELDRQWNFPRFMELPRELRFNVYEALLVGSETLHPAILRTSKQIHAEALPVLYKRNKFSAKLKYCTEDRPFRPSLRPPLVGCCLIIKRPGSESSLHQHITRQVNIGTLLCRLLRDRTMCMLRTLTHFTVDIDLATPCKDKTGAYVDQLYDAFASLCLAFIDSRKLKELTVKVNTSDSHVTSASLAFMLWPLLFLHTDVVVKIEGASAVPVVEREQFTRVVLEVLEEILLGRSIARVRKLCSAEIEKRWWENDDGGNHPERLDAVHDIERALWRVDYNRIHRIRLDDILNRSPVWERVREVADRVKVEMEDLK